MRTISDIQILSLDLLWKEAETLGRIEVDRPGLMSSEYRVRIRFQRSSGTLVYAAGVSVNITEAISLAIQEARELS